MSAASCRGFDRANSSTDGSGAVTWLPLNLWRRNMSSLVVLGFDGIHTADEVLNKVRPMQKEHLIDLEDACVVERGKDGKVHIKQAVNLTALGAATGGVQGMLLGTLVGLLFLSPLAVMALWSAAGG